MKFDDSEPLPFSFEALPARQKHLAALIGVMFAGVFYPEFAVSRTYIDGEIQRDTPLAYRDTDPLWADLGEKKI